jgi:hypothetical protein
MSKIDSITFGENIKKIVHLFLITFYCQENDVFYSNLNFKLSLQQNKFNLNKTSYKT